MPSFFERPKIGYWSPSHLVDICFSAQCTFSITWKIKFGQHSVLKYSSCFRLRYFKRFCQNNSKDTFPDINAEEPDAIIYTRDKAVMRQLDALVTEYPDIFKCIGETDIDKTYSMPKSRISYRKPRRISDAKREQARVAIKNLNRRRNNGWKRLCYP